MSEQTSREFLCGLFDRPDRYVRQIDLVRRQAVVVPMDRAAYTCSTFLDWRVQSGAGSERLIPLRALRAQYLEARPAPRPIHFLFHTAFSGSTLLCRLLDLPGRCLPYKEPFLLHQLAFLRRGLPLPGWRVDHRLNRPMSEDLGGVGFLELTLALLRRTYEPAELPLVKPSDSCINLAHELLSAHPGSRALLLYNSPQPFLVSMLKRPDRRQYMRSLLDRGRVDLASSGPLARIDPSTLPDGEAAGYLWLSLAYAFVDLLAVEELALRSLDAARLMADPQGMRDAMARHLGLASTETEPSTLSALLGQHAKHPDRPFDRHRHAAEQRQLLVQLREPIRQGLRFIERASVNRSLPLPLPRPLG